MLPKVSLSFNCSYVSHMFKNYRIAIINSTVATETILSMKTFLRNFLVTFSECSMFTFVIVELVPKFGFCFPNVGNFTRDFAF